MRSWRISSVDDDGVQGQEDGIIAKLAYDARYITSEPTGIGRLCLELLQGFASLSGGPPIKVLISQHAALPHSLFEVPHLEFCTVPWKPHGLRDQILLPGFLRQQGVCLLHGVDAFNPVLMRGVRLVTTIHDVIPLRCAHLLRKSKKARLLPLWKAWLKLQCARAQAVITVSRHAAGDIACLLQVPRHKIHVIYNPVRPWSAFAPVEAFRQKFGLRGRVVSYVGRHDPYKNVVGLIRAMAIVKQLYQGTVQLVVAGRLDPRYPEASREVVRLGLADTVVFPGYLNDANLGALYKASDVFVFPSLYEGFGLPPIEAMTCGTPVIASDRTALPEILGDAALLIDPENPQLLAASIVRVLTDPVLAQQLGQAGLRHAARFSVRTATEQHVALYEHILSQGEK